MTDVNSGTRPRPTMVLEQIERDLSEATTGLAAAQDVQLDTLGRMSAEAVLKQFEAAAVSFEEMGQEVKVRIARLNARLMECDADIKQIEETAKSIRDKGKLAYAQIEEVNELSKEIRNTCALFKSKLSGPP